jgi:hypothetical protein
MPKVDEGNMQVEEINDLLGNMVPAQSASVVSDSQTTNNEQQALEVSNVEEGQERPAEEAIEQKHTEQQQAETQQEEVAADQPQAQATAQQTQAQQQEQPPQKTELELLKEENAKLLAQMNEIAGRIVAPPQPQKTPDQIKHEENMQAQQARQVLQFLPSEELFDEALKSKDNFNALLTAVRNSAIEASLRMMPQLATQIVDHKIAITETVKDFYRDNKDLVPYKQFVGYTTNEVAAQHPDWTLSQILEETEKVVRERLQKARVAEAVADINSQSNQTQSRNIRTAGENPGFVPGGGSGRRGTTSSDGNLSAEAKDIISLIS